jgi:PTH1 family peptidyl-tRNA hydrolase
MDPAAYLLRDFEKDEWPMVEDLIAKAVAAIETILSQGLEAAMNHFNGALASDPLQD